MQVDHRQPYSGDHGIRFEPVSDISQARIADLFQRQKAAKAAEELQCRVAAALPFIPFSSQRERQRFGLAVQKVASFEELPQITRNLILAGEHARAVGPPPEAS